MKNEIMVQDNKIKIEDCIGLNDTKTKTITLYWQWPYETGENDYEISLNDAKDSRWMGHDIEIAVNATSRQVLEKVTYLADSVQIGDYVNYDATSGDGAGLTITPQESQTGSSTLTTFNSSDITGWRVYDKDPITKTVLLIAEEPTNSTLTFYGITVGWKNSINVLNSIGDIYGHGNGAKSGRSMNDKDIEKHSSFVKEEYNNRYHTIENIDINNGGTADNLGYYYYTGNPNRIETETFYKGTFVKEDNTVQIATNENPITMKQNYYSYSGSSYIQNPWYNIIFKKSANESEKKTSYWVGGHYVQLHPTICAFILRVVSEAGLYGVEGAAVRSSAVMPMVTLQSNIQTTGKNTNNVWQLNVE